ASSSSSSSISSSSRSTIPSSDYSTTTGTQAQTHVNTILSHNKWLCSSTKPEPVLLIRDTITHGLPLFFSLFLSLFHSVTHSVSHRHSQQEASSGKVVSNFPLSLSLSPSHSLCLYLSLLSLSPL